MKITRIDFEGRDGRYATAQRKTDGKNKTEMIVVTTMSPEHAVGRDHFVNAECEDDIFSMAECIQMFLDGYEGTNSDIHDYYLELLRLSEI